MARIKRSLSSPPSPPVQEGSPISDGAAPSTPPSANKKGKTTPKPSTDKKKSRTTSETPRAYNPWTSQDRQILLELVEKVCKEHLWAEVKADGRLVERKQGGVQGHWASLLKKLNKEAEGKA